MDSSRSAEAYLRWEAIGRRQDVVRLQHPEGIDTTPRPPAQGWYADLRQDSDREDHHLGGGAIRLYRERQGQDPGQGRDPSRPAEAHLCWKAAGGRKDTVRLQHPEGIDPPSRPPAQGRGIVGLMMGILVGLKFFVYNIVKLIFLR